MGRKLKFPSEVKIEICDLYLEGKYSRGELAEKYGFYEDTIYKWVHRYQKEGETAFQERSHNQKYTKEFKTEVVEAYLNGEGSIDFLAVRYGIPSLETVRRWIAKYNNHEELKDYDPKPEVYMAEKHRKTTLEERITIVEYCIEHNKNYKDTAEKYDVSYTQVYKWVKKYLESGEEGLVDNRGKRKPEEELSEVEALKRKISLQNKLIEEKNMEIEVLKKVQEIERRRSSPRQGTKRNI
ncbi:MAG: transposase [Erysipelotrichaceae bacterium]|nr:transposase [Erysipelotrichaceae bacterium]